MKATLEISMYPLSEDYIRRIDEFVALVKKEDGLFVEVNSTSTRISGDFALLNTVFQNTVQKSWEKYGQAIFVSKWLMGDLINEA